MHETAMHDTAMHDTALPSIWVGSHRSGDDWARTATERAAVAAVVDAIDDRMLISRHPTDLDAWCAACGGVRAMRVHWHFAATEPDGSVHPAWTETANCAGCGLNSRMRAVVDFFAQHAAGSDHAPCLVAEQITPSYPVFQRLFPSVTGSEYLGPDHRSGDTVAHSSGVELRHEDLTALSFADATFGTVITQDVFEHVPDFRSAFREVRRVLRPDGRLVFTIPFFPDAAHTIVRATVGDDGTVTHVLPPEIHGNPVGDGSLCFQHFGWDILDSLRECGFADAAAHAYWGPWQGHLGHPFFVFEAAVRPTS
jgi:SAM-dependent methyltransferase